MHFTIAPTFLLPRAATKALTVALLCGAILPQAQAQTLVDTTTTIGVQNTLDQSTAPGGTGIIQKVQNKLQNVATTQQNAINAAAALGDTSGKPAVVVTPLTPTQQTALNVAQANLQAGKLAQARAQFETLVSQNYNNPEPHFGLALTLLAQKDDKGATFELNQFRLLAPDRYEGAYNLGVIASRAGRYDDALKLYTEAATLSQGKASPEVSMQILNALAGEQTRKADFAGLTTTLTQLAALQPDNYDVQYRLAQAQTLSGTGTQALPGLYALVQKQPQRADVVNLIADIYIAQGLPDRAMREINAALSRVGNPQARSALLLHKANILAAQGDTKSAVYSAQAAHMQDKTNVDAWIKEGQLRLQRNDRSGALTAYQNAAQVAPKDARTRLELANVRLTLGQYADAAQDAARALTLTPDAATTARAQYVQGVALYRLGNYSQARNLLNSSALSTPSADTTLWLGLTNYALKDYPAAAAALSESVKLNPTLIARQNLASALLASGRYAEAEAILSGIVTDNPKNADYWYLLGLAQRSQNKTEEARKSLHTAAGLGNTRAVEALK